MMEKKSSICMNKVIRINQSSGLTLFVFMSFVTQYITAILGQSFVYLFGLICASLIIVISKKKLLLYVDPLTILWGVVTINILFSIVTSSVDNAKIMEFVTFFVGFLVLLTCRTDLKMHKKALKVIRVMSIYYASTIWIQMLVPSVYHAYLNLLPSDISWNVKTGIGAEINYMGFSTNSGFTAGHIVAGMIVSFCGLLSGTTSKYKKRDIMIFIFLTVSLLMTGKRGHLLAACVALIIMFVISTKGIKRLVRINAIILALAAVLTLAIVLGEALSVIPFFNEFWNTFTGLVNGEDVTSGRIQLYQYSLQLFQENPIFGIGWGEFKEAGSIVYSKSLDVHNVYLQLLCETGIVGTILVLVSLFVSLFSTNRQWKMFSGNQHMNTLEKELSLFSMGYQVFFLLYSFTGNPLYDNNYVILYFFACSLCIPKRMTYKYAYLSDAVMSK